MRRRQETSDRLQSVSADGVREQPGNLPPIDEDDAFRQSGASPPRRRASRSYGLGIMSAGAVHGRPTPCSFHPLPSVEALASVPPEQVVPMLVHLSALQVALATRLPTPPLAASEVRTPSRLVTAKELAVELTFTVARVYELARTHSIPSVRIGRTVRFDVQAVRKALAS